MDKRALDSLIAPQHPANPAMKEVVPTVTKTIPPFKENKFRMIISR